MAALPSFGLTSYACSPSACSHAPGPEPSSRLSLFSVPWNGILPTTNTTRAWSPIAPPRCSLLSIPSPQGAPEAFLLVASVAWQHLTPHTRRAVRASCRSGRQLHDSLWEHLQLDLEIPGRFDAGSRGLLSPAPTPSELRTCVSGVLQRGARLQGMTLSFQHAPYDEPLPPQEREQQM